MLYDMIVIGGGPAGYTAALYAGRANLSVLVLEKLAPGGQMGTTDQIDNYPGFPEGINGFQLAMEMKKGAERFGAETKLAAVTEVRLAGDIKEVEAGGERFQGKTVVLACGAHPRELGLPGKRSCGAGAFPTAPPATACSSGAKPWLWQAAATQRRLTRCTFPGFVKRWS